MNRRLTTVCTVMIGLLLVGFEAGAQEKAKKATESKETLKPRTEMFSLGDEAPYFSLQSHQGTTVTLTEFRGKKRVILVFYPGDNTPACTQQLCSFRDRYKMFADRDIVILGINPARAESHKAFAEKNRFPFSLLVDKGGKVAAAYGCRASNGTIIRTVYAIGKYGKVEFAERGAPAWVDVVDSIDAVGKQGPPQ
jgi:peroxiredoxin Q/BCP